MSFKVMSLGWLGLLEKSPTGWWSKPQGILSLSSVSFCVWIHVKNKFTSSCLASHCSSNNRFAIPH